MDLPVLVNKESTSSINEMIQMDNTASDSPETTSILEGDPKPVQKCVILDIPETVVDGEQTVKESAEKECSTEQGERRTILDAYTYDY